MAVCLLHAYVNPDHELAVRERLQDQLPDIPVALSHEITREWRESSEGEVDEQATMRRRDAGAA